MAFLPGWSWIINARGYANIVHDLTTGIVADVPASELSNHACLDSNTAEIVQGVWGAVYTLGEADEGLLDGYEGVPVAYTKEVHRVAVIDARKGNGEKAAAAGAAGGNEHAWIEALVYVDRQRVAWGPPKKEYVFRIRFGVDDAIEAGMDKDWGKTMIRGMMRACARR